MVFAGELTSVRVKPRLNKIELSYELKTDSPNYDAGSTFPIQSLKFSSQPVKPKTNYAVGIMRDGMCVTQHRTCHCAAVLTLLVVHRCRRRFASHTSQCDLSVETCDGLHRCCQCQEAGR